LLAKFISNSSRLRW